MPECLCTNAMDIMEVTEGDVQRSTKHLYPTCPTSYSFNADRMKQTRIRHGAIRRAETAEKKSRETSRREMYGQEVIRQTHS